MSGGDGCLMGGTPNCSTRFVRQLIFYSDKSKFHKFSNWWVGDPIYDWGEGGQRGSEASYLAWSGNSNHSLRCSENPKISIFFPTEFQGEE